MTKQREIIRKELNDTIKYGKKKKRQFENWDKVIIASSRESQMRNRSVRYDE